MSVLQNISYWKMISLSVVNILVAEEKNMKITCATYYKKWKECTLRIIELRIIIETAIK